MLVITAFLTGKGTSRLRMAQKAAFLTARQIAIAAVRILLSHASVRHGERPFSHALLFVKNRLTLKRRSPPI
jgi:hypothetical protein